VVAKLQVYCSEDLGAFYLDVLKDRLYTTQADSHARRSAQTALWYITQAMLRWMAPFLSFTAEEAWQLAAPVGQRGQSIFCATYSSDLGTPDTALLDKWNRIRELRALVTKEIESLRAQGAVGSSLQAQIELTAGPEDYALLASLGDDLKFAFIVSAIELKAGDAIAVKASAVTTPKCERCWHYRADVNTDAAHPWLCARCVTNLYGAGETRRVA
jgi:isoleucyl-tRNA synthetase